MGIFTTQDMPTFGAVLFRDGEFTLHQEVVRCTDVATQERCISCEFVYSPFDVHNHHSPTAFPVASILLLLNSLHLILTVLSVSAFRKIYIPRPTFNSVAFGKVSEVAFQNASSVLQFVHP